MYLENDTESGNKNVFMFRNIEPKLHNIDIFIGSLT